MRKLIISLIAIWGVSWGHAEGINNAVKHEVGAIQTQIGPRKNYRVSLAKSYFGGGTKCRKWNKFCGK